MKKLFTLIIIIVFASMLLSTKSAKASHAQGADITYAYTGTPNQYLVTLRFYRDCMGILAPSSADICYQSASLGFDSSATIYPIPGTGNPIPQSSCVIITNPCNGSSGFGTEEWIYQGIITLPQAATDWIFAYQICCRNIASTTLSNASGFGLYVSAHLNSVDFPTNSSPYFDSIPVTTFCVNNQFYYYQGAHDVDGDSLHYSLVDAEDAIGPCPLAPYSLQYNSPYSPTNPLSTANGITIDPLTGVISFIPNLIQVAVICVLTEDYDTTQFPAVKKGSTKRELQILIVNNCVFIQPTPIGLGSSGGYNNALIANCLDTSIILRLSDPVQCASIAVDGSDFRAIAPNGQPNPIFHAEAVNCVSGKTDSVRIFFYYPLTQTRTALYIKMGTDGNTLLTECGNSIYETNGSDTITINDTINIIVQDTSVIDLNVPNISSCVFDTLTVNLNDQLLCSTIRADASDFKLTDATGTQFTLTQAYGNCSGSSPSSPGSYTTSITVISSQTVNGVSPFYLIALNGSDTNTISNLCGTFYNAGDTIAVIDASIPPVISLGPDISQCVNQPFPVLDAGVSAAASYLWSTGETTQTIIADTSDTYTVTVTFGFNCTSSDEIIVDLFDLPVPPNLGDQHICYNDSISSLNANPFGNQPANATYLWTDSAGAVVATTSLFTPTLEGTYTVTISNSSCSITDDAIVTIEAPLTVNLGAAQTICENNSANFVAGYTGTATVNFDWNYNGIAIGSNSNQLTANAPGIYSVLITDQFGCTATCTTLLEVENILPAPVPTCYTQPAGSPYLYIYTWEIVPGALGYEVSLDDGATWLIPNTPQGPTSEGVNGSEITFVVRALGDYCPAGQTSLSPPCELNIPNVVTPNNDGFNDSFSILNLGKYTNAKLCIFNQWGREVYFNDNYGSANNYDFKNQPEGSYFYTLSIPDQDGKSGTITLLKNK